MKHLFLPLIEGRTTFSKRTPSGKLIISSVPKRYNSKSVRDLCRTGQFNPPNTKK